MKKKHIESMVFTQIQMHAVYLGGLENGNWLCAPWKRGKIYTLVYGVEQTVDKTSPKVFEYFTNRFRHYLAEHFGDATCFEIYMEGWDAAWKRSMELRGTKNNCPTTSSTMVNRLSEKLAV